MHYPYEFMSEFWTETERAKGVCKHGVSQFGVLKSAEEVKWTEGLMRLLLVSFNFSEQ